MIANKKLGFFSPPGSRGGLQVGSGVRYGSSTFDFSPIRIECIRWGCCFLHLSSRILASNPARATQHRSDRTIASRSREIQSTDGNRLRIFNGFDFHFTEASRQIIVNFSFSCNPRSHFARQFSVWEIIFSENISLFFLLHIDDTHGKRCGGNMWIFSRGYKFAFRKSCNAEMMFARSFRRLRLFRRHNNVAFVLSSS
jgi:hypothetical protein